MMKSPFCLPRSSRHVDFVLSSGSIAQKKCERNGAAVIVKKISHFKVYFYTLVCYNAKNSAYKWYMQLTDYKR